jgi:hypothetical protein
MSILDTIQAGMDAVYVTLGVAAQWTPAGGAAVPFTALVGGGDQVAQFHGVTNQINVAARFYRARVSELSVVAPGLTPAAGDLVDSLDATGAVIDSFVITGQPRREDPHRLEWTLDLAAA